MSDKVTLYHPELKKTIEVFEKAVPVHEESGWTTDVPSSKRSQSAPPEVVSPGSSGSDEGSK